MSEGQKLFWTGGWDSTFRLLQLLFIEKRTAEPYYLIDEERGSCEIEMETMNRIREKILELYPEAGSNLKPVRFFHFNNIEVDQEIRTAWRTIRNDRHLGQQYIWLASFCKQNQISNIEISIEKRESEKEVRPRLDEILSSEPLNEPYSTIFRYFSFPLLDVSKSEMIRMAGENGWEDILGLTWFCHHPITLPFYGKASCGVCNPCRIAIREGFKDRVPFMNRHLGLIAKKVYNDMRVVRLLQQLSIKS